MSLDKFGRHSDLVDRETLEQNILTNIEAKLIQNSIGTFNSELKLLNQRLNENEENIDKLTKQKNLYETEVKELKEKSAQNSAQIDMIKNTMSQEMKPLMNMANKNIKVLSDLEGTLNGRISQLEIANKDNQLAHDSISEKITHAIINLQAIFDEKLKQLESRLH